MLTLPIAELTVDQVRALSFDELVKTCTPPVIEYLGPALNERARELESSGDPSSFAIAALLAIVCSFGLREDDSREPFGPMMLMEGMRSPIPADLEDGHFKMLEVTREAVTHPELVARISDVLWQRKARSVTDARRAIEAYMECAHRTDNPAHWVEPFRRVKRAFQIAAQIRNGVPEPIDAVDAWILNRVRSLRGVDPLYYSDRLMGLLLLNARSDEERRELALQATETAKQALDGGDASRAECYYRTASSWYQSLQDDVEAKASRIAAAETIVARARAQPQTIAKAGLLAEAIGALRNAGASAGRVAAIRTELHAAQQASTSEFKTISAEVDITEMVQSSRKAASSLPFADALLKLSRMFHIPTMSDLRAEVERLIKKAPFRMSISSRRVDQFGRVTGIRPGILGGAEDQELAIIAEMHDAADRRRRLAVDGVINPFRREMLVEHAPTVGDFAQTLRYRPFIPSDRLEFFARGLHAGYYGDFLESTHILAPALEHALRMLLALAGTLPYSQDPQGIQDFFTLERILGEPALEATLGEDYIFELRGVLVSRFGDNYRNNVAHGLLSPSETRGPIAVYLWWLTLKLVFSLNVVDPSDSGEAEGPG